ncbi:MAG: hypothetical protein ABIK28_22470 [Planctomycetota bacterium]
MACTKERSSAIGELVAGRLGPAETEALLDHIGRCAACSVEFDDLADLIGAMERSGPDPAGHIALAGAKGWGRFPWKTARIVAAAILVCIAAWWAAPEQRIGGTALGRLAVIDPIPAASLLLRSEESPALPAGYASAMDWYAQQRYDHAAFRLEQVLTQNPDHLLSHLYLGICRLNTDKAREALFSLSRVAGQGQGLLRERALWYLGNAYLKLNERENALSRFTELDKLGNDYELNAREMIDKIREIPEP